MCRTYGSRGIRHSLFSWVLGTSLGFPCIKGEKVNAPPLPEGGGGYLGVSNDWCIRRGHPPKF